MDPRERSHLKHQRKLGFLTTEQRVLPSTEDTARNGLQTSRSTPHENGGGDPRELMFPPPLKQCPHCPVACRLPCPLELRTPAWPMPDHPWPASYALPHR